MEEILISKELRSERNIKKVFGLRIRRCPVTSSLLSGTMGIAISTMIKSNLISILTIILIRENLQQNKD